MWKPDTTTYNNIQSLIKFVDFISDLPFSKVQNKIYLTEIAFLIKNIHKAETHKEWNLSLDIYDYSFHSETKKEGVYWRNWSVSFESGRLDIEAKSHHTEEPLGFYKDDFNYYGVIYFEKEIKNERIYLDVAISEFIKDAFNYKKYITNTLKDIEIDIDIWEHKKLKE
ncbi:hypothetical protein [Polaribacter uvawellassae]|uniref:hypothetical protein n=1 Tax=Polaribacter uvawellassae TaxID=3133495 RepID=UPI00321BEF38